MPQETRGLLTSLGWLVLRVPYYEWDSLQGKRARVLYLRGILPASITDRHTIKAA
jgi:hypothetical protein